MNPTVPRQIEIECAAANLPKQKIGQYSSISKWAQLNKIPPIYNLYHLSLISKIPYTEIVGFINKRRENYKIYNLKKNTKGFREIAIPCTNLLSVQRAINKHVLSHIPSSPYSYAYEHGRSIKDCASNHLKAKWLISLDIRNFFGSIDEIDCYKVLTQSGISDLLAFQIAKLSTIDGDISPRIPHAYSPFRQTNIGYLPQGAATSPAMSNLVMKQMDIWIANIAEKYNFTYTRYADDLSFSTHLNSTRSQCEQLIYDVKNALLGIGFHLNNLKTHISDPGAQKFVLGLNVNESQLKCRKEYVGNIKWNIRILEKHGLSGLATSLKVDEFQALNILCGRINFVKDIDPELGSSLLSKINKSI